MRRRDVLHLFGTTWAFAACGTDSKPPCVISATGTSSYCLVADEILRVPRVASLPTGQAMLFNVDDNTAVVVARDGSGLYAMSGICTHQCCLVSLCVDDACSTLGTNPGGCNATVVATPAATGAAIICPCHGSAFAIDGSVLTGPAIRPLPHYKLSLDGDDALVDTSRAVASTTRA